MKRIRGIFKILFKLYVVKKLLLCGMRFGVRENLSCSRQNHQLDNVESG